MEGTEGEVIEGQVLDHLGLIMSVIERVGLMEKVDLCLPMETNKGVKVTMGQRCAALVLNGLGFMNHRLYLFEQFLSNKPVEALFGSGICAEHFNDDALGRFLDAVSEYGVTKFFSTVSYAIGKEQNLMGRTIHGDTTTLTVYGEYSEDGETSYEGPRPQIGYSKDHKIGFKQMVLHLATTGATAFPLWMEAHSGNASDKKTLESAAQRIRQFHQSLEIDDEFLYVGDSAFYEAAVHQKSDMKWLSRVPHTIREAGQWIERDDLEWIPLDEGYRMHIVTEHYGSVEQRWALIESQHAYHREIKTLQRKIEKEEGQIGSWIKRLRAEEFKCEADAHKCCSKSKKWTYHQVTYQIETIKKHKAAGRPKKGALPEVTGFRIQAEYVRDEEKIASASRRAGRFILATNEWDQDRLKDRDILKVYKEQSGTEKGFQFIKDDAFEVDSIFLKKPSRIQALMAVMCLCLLIYGFAQYQLREGLREREETIPDQRKKPTQNPTMRWVAFLFHGIQIITLPELQRKMITNMNSTCRLIVTLFGQRAGEIYGMKFF